MNATIEAGLISGGTVLVGVVLAEWLRRLGERRRRRFELLVNGRGRMEMFARALDENGGHVSWDVIQAVNDIQTVVVELSSLTHLRSLRWRRRRQRTDALKGFLLMLGAARFRLSNGPAYLRRPEVDALKAAMVAYERTFGAQITPQDEETMMRYVERGLDGADPAAPPSRTQRARPPVQPRQEETGATL